MTAEQARRHKEYMQRVSNNAYRAPKPVIKKSAEVERQRLARDKAELIKLAREICCSVEELL